MTTSERIVTNKQVFMNHQGIFQISADFELNKKPAWLDDFRAKYDLPYDFHITFKTDTYFNIEDKEKLVAEIEDITKNHKRLTVVFNELYISPTPKGWCIMIRAGKNEELLDFQKEVSEAFSKYGDIITKEKEGYEKDFQPHITIGRHLSDEQFKKAKGELKENLVCDAVIDSLTLTTVKEATFEQWAKPENRMFFEIA